MMPAVMQTFATLNLNVPEFVYESCVRKYFYSSSASIYSAHTQIDRYDPA